MAHKYTQCTFIQLSFTVNTNLLSPSHGAYFKNIFNCVKVVIFGADWY